MTTPKRKRGRPEGGKYPEAIRQYWKLTQQNYRQKMRTEANKELTKSRRVK